MNAVLMHFQVAGREDEAADLSRDAVGKADMTIAELWALPVHHLLFQFYDPPARATEDTDALATVTRRNRGLERPYIPMWVLPEAERT